MRHTSFSAAILFASAVVVAAGGCHSSPDELAPREAAAAPLAPADAAPTADASAAAANPPVDAGDADSGLRGELNDFCHTAFTADQDRMREKCSPSDLALSGRLGRAAGDLCAHDMVIALGRKRADFDAEAGKKCVEMLREKQLAQTSETDSLFQHFPCDRVLLGMQGEGQPCLFSVECKDGLACVGYQIGVDGTCRKPPPARQACTLQPYGSILTEAASTLHHPACAPGAYCDGTTCQPRVPAGKACSKSTMCAAGLSCVMGKCGQRPAAGAACAATTDCAFGLWCDRGGDGGAGKCAPKRTDGQECFAQEACKGKCDLPPKKDDNHPPPPGKCVAVCGSG
jgi:hypothetical protein